MKHLIKKVAVLGSGVMGSGIACHFANIGLEVIMLDIVPFDLKEEEKSNKSARNRIVNDSLKAILKAKPAPLYDKRFASRISTGNFDDDLHKIEDCDWVIEVIIERLDIKKSLFEKVEKYRRPGSLITTNTSGIPIHLLAEGRSEDFQKNFCGTHFFNPPRYLKLFEVIPHAGTDTEVVDFFMHYGDIFLGKTTVLAKDTPAFIGNRIGVYSGMKSLELTDKYHLTIEEVDALTGPAIGRPKTGTFRLQDLVGLDTNEKVSKGVIDNCPNDEYVESLGSKETPKYISYLLENNFIGDKTGQGFYKKTKERDKDGRRVILSLDLDACAYRPRKKPNLESLKVAKKVEKVGKRIRQLITTGDNGGKFLRDYFLGLFAYSSNRIPEIANNLYSIDDAMKAGYAWDYGPFEYWDMVGVAEGVDTAEANGESVAQWVKDMLNKGYNSFYKSENGKRYYYNIDTKTYKEIPGTEGIIVLDNYSHQEPVFKNSECTLHDIGDGVLCLEFTSKANAIGEGIGLGLIEAVSLAEQGDWKGIVIGNNAKNFTVGANLMGMAMVVMQKDWKKLDGMVDGFQQVNMRLRYSEIPVVIATQGYVFGGGCEMLMHCDAAMVSPESYIGLVEVGVGLIPGGGGTKEMALRASEKFFKGDIQIPTLLDAMTPLATAKVSTSAQEAFNIGYLKKDRDVVVMNGSRNIGEAKRKVLELARNYTQPIAKEVHVMGRDGLSTLYSGIHEYMLGNYMSKYDVEIARKISYILCGGDLTGQQKVSEQYLLDLEREAFLSLLGNQKTIDRIQYMLQYRKPLRN